MIITIIRRGLGLVLAAVVVASCGDPKPSPTPSIPEVSGSVSVCDLVAGMDELVGRTAVGPPSSYTVGSSERCLWVYMTDPSRYVAVTLGERSNHADTIQSFGDGDVVVDLGDEARWWESNRTVSVVVGEQSIQVDLQLEDAADPKALAVSIAQAAVEDLR